MAKLTRKFKFPLLSGISKYGEKKPYYEQVVIYDGAYPFAMMNVDTLFNSDDRDNPIYLDLLQGNALNITMTLETDDPQ